MPRIIPAWYGPAGRRRHRSRLCSIVVPVLLDRLRERLRRVSQPLRRTSCEIIENGAPLSKRGEMHVGGLGAHRAQKLHLVALFGQVRQVDRVGFGRQPPNQPTADDELKRIARTNSVSEDALIVRLSS